MQTAELKLMLIDKINKIDDDRLLMEAFRLIDIEIPFEEKVFEFSDSQVTKIKQAIQQIQNGEYLTSEDANMEIDQWLKG